MEKLPQDPMYKMLRFLSIMTDGDLSCAPKELRDQLWGHVTPEEIQRQKNWLRAKIKESSQKNQNRL